MREGITATDLVLQVVQMLRAHGVVGKFVEFHGSGLDQLPLADRATIANMAPEYGATCGFFPVDAQTLAYLRLTGRDADTVALVEAYCKAQGMWRDEHYVTPHFAATLHLDMSTVEPNLAGPRRPQDRVAVRDLRRATDEYITLDGKAGQLDTAFPLEGGTSIPAPRRCGDRSDYILYQHLQSRRDDRRGTSGAKGAGARPAAQALGKIVTGTRLESSHRLPDQGRPAGRVGCAGFQPGGLRLYHLYRQLRPIAGSGGKSDYG